MADSAAEVATLSESVNAPRNGIRAADRDVFDDILVSVKGTFLTTKC